MIYLEFYVIFISACLISQFNYRIKVKFFTHFYFQMHNIVKMHRYNYIILSDAEKSGEKRKHVLTSFAVFLCSKLVKIW